MIEILNIITGTYEPFEVFLQRAKDQMKNNNWTVDRQMQVVKRVVRVFRGATIEEILEKFRKGLEEEIK